MKKEIVVDSCCDLNKEIKNDIDIKMAPCCINIENEYLVDDGSIDIEELLSKMKESDEPARSNCPSPDAFLEKFNLIKAKEIFTVTLSSYLSGAYNSAKVAAEMFVKEHKDSKIHIFDSKSACAGETLTLLKIKECLENKLPYKEIITVVEKFIKNMRTLFVLESLDNLIKNGRVSKFKGLISSVLNIMPIMGDDGDGQIEVLDKVRGKKKVYNKLVEMIGNLLPNQKDRTIVISHCNAEQRANKIKKLIEDLYNFKNIFIVETNGIGATYANDGGIVVAF